MVPRRLLGRRSRGKGGIAPPNGSKAPKKLQNTLPPSSNAFFSPPGHPPIFSKIRHNEGAPARSKAACRTKTRFRSESGHIRASETPTKSTNAPNTLPRERTLSPLDPKHSKSATTEGHRRVTGGVSHRDQIPVGKRPHSRLGNTHEKHQSTKT